MSSETVKLFNSRFLYSNNKMDLVPLSRITSYLASNGCDVSKINTAQKFRKWMKDLQIDTDPKIADIPEFELVKYNVERPGYYLFYYRDNNNVKLTDYNSKKEASSIADVETISSKESDEADEADDMTLKTLEKSVVGMQSQLNQIRSEISEATEGLKTIKDLNNRNYRKNDLLHGRIERVHDKLNSFKDHQTVERINNIHADLKELKNFHRNKENGLISRILELESEIKNVSKQRNEMISIFDHYVDNPLEFIKYVSNKNKVNSKELIEYLYVINEN